MSDTFVRFYTPLDWFFRVRGYGLSVRRLAGHRPLFTERFGYRRAYHVLGLCVMPLKRGA